MTGPSCDEPGHTTWTSSTQTCPSPILTPLLLSQTPLQESLIELSDNNHNKMATDMFLGMGRDWPGPWARGIPPYLTPLVTSPRVLGGFLPLTQTRGSFERGEAPSCPGHSLSRAADAGPLRWVGS